MTELKTCKVCGNPVSENAPVCPHCGEPFPASHITCPNCGSADVAMGEQGYSLKRAAAGGLLLGPVGLLGGLVGKKKAEYSCRSCGYRWKPTTP